jgi:hypothetical protein
VKVYAKASTSLAVIAEDTGSNLIYLANGDYDTNLAMTVYSIKASNAGVGAVSSKVKGVLNDEPIFLSKTGLYGITTNYFSEKYSISRSGKINKKLCKEAHLENAVGISFNGYFYLALSNPLICGKNTVCSPDLKCGSGRASKSDMYILDSRHRDASRNGDNSYECYYFEGLPAITAMYVVNNRMLFSDGSNIYTWNDDLADKYKYLDYAVYDEELDRWLGEPVACKWTSAIDADGAAQYYKTLSKRGTMVTIAPPMQTSCQVTLVKDAHDQIYIGRFDGSTFALSDSVLDGFTKKKVKKYKRLQFVLENKEPEPFGVISIVKTFTLGNHAKR